VEVGDGLETEVDVGGVVDDGGGETVELPPPLLIAAALKASNLSPGFTAKTMPC
jgi:hypothetical protein